MRRFLSAALSVCLLAGLASGCKGGGDGKAEVPMGRYIEEQGESLDGLTRVFDFHSTADGGMTFYGSILLDDQTGESAYRKYTVPAGGGAVTSVEVPGVSEFAPTGARSLADSPDGALYILYLNKSFRPLVGRSVNGGAFETVPLSDQDAAPAEGGQAPGVASPGAAEAAPGSSVVVDLPTGDGDAAPDGGDSAPADAGSDTDTTSGFVFFEGGMSMPDKIASGLLPLEDGFIILYGDKGASRYSADGKLMGEYLGNAYATNPIVSNGSLIISSTDSTALWSYDLSSNKQNGTYTYDGMKMGTYVSADEENVYLADSTGIYRQAKGSTLWEKMVDGDLTSLVMPNLSVAGLAPDGSGGFGALLSGENSAQFMRYVYSAETPTNPDTELTIFSLRDNNTIRQAIGEFQRRNPNVRVNFRVGMEADSTATTEDVIRALNTELLAGKGPDLLLLDGLPVDSYVEKSVLADLGGFIKEQSGLLSNLMNAYAYDGKLYGIPSRFTFPVMMGTEADVNSINSLTALVERVKADQGGEPPFLRPSNDLWEEDGVGILMDYYDVSSASWRAADGSIDQAALTEFLTNMAELDKTMKEHTPQAGGNMAFVTMVASVANGAGVEEINMGASDIKDGTARFHTQEMSGIFAVDFVSQNLNGMAGQTLAPLFGGGAYTPRGGVGLNAAGKQQDLARSFLEMLLSSTVQDNYLYDGYPVNAGSLEKLVKDSLGGTTENDMGFLSMCGQLDTPLLSDQVIKDAVQEQMKDLMSGAVTPEQAAANVVENTKLYLSE